MPIFSRRFYLLFILALLPISLSFLLPIWAYVGLAIDAGLLVIVFVDLWLFSPGAGDVTVTRRFESRFAVRDTTDVIVTAANTSLQPIVIRLRDEPPIGMIAADPPEFELEIASDSAIQVRYGLRPERRGSYTFGDIVFRQRSRLGLSWRQTTISLANTIKVYPSLRRARELELRAIGAESFIAVQRRAQRRGEGREFESMRDYVRGDELRHVSWSATARRSKLITRQYQIERDQTVIVAIDGGRLMTGRIDGVSKFDTAVEAALALISACGRAGDNSGLLVFARGVQRFIPARRGAEHLDAVLEALYDVDPELVEPSYSRAFQFISSHIKRRSLVVVLTDLIDKEASRELIAALGLLRPRHLPLVVTFGDRDLNAVVSRGPNQVRDLFVQSAAEEIIHQRGAALRAVEARGGLALDVTAKTLVPRLLQQYLRIKERGLL